MLRANVILELAPWRIAPTLQQLPQQQQGHFTTEDTEGTEDHLGVPSSVCSVSSVAKKLLLLLLRGRPRRRETEQVRASPDGCPAVLIGLGSLSESNRAARRPVHARTG